MKSSVISALRRAESLLRFQVTVIFVPWIAFAVAESTNFEKLSFRFSNWRIRIDPELNLDT